MGMDIHMRNELLRERECERPNAHTHERKR
jgi:hypothetical protein